MPLFVVVTKTDKSSQEEVDHTTEAIVDTLLTDKGKVAYPVHTSGDVETAAQTFRDGR